MKGIIFNIQRFTIHDGPGMRTELFLKGCPLRCEWCSNPESQKLYIQPGVYKTKCISQKKCGICAGVCPQDDALQFYRGKLVSIDRSRCTHCMECADMCPSEAIRQWGRLMSTEECMKEIRKDMDFYKRSGGGVTVSGGEPLLQSDFVAELFRACKDEQIHTCCESTFHMDWSEIEKVKPYTDLFISDIKHMDSDIHRARTGAGNEKVLENLRKLASADTELILRIPVIPGFNDDDANIEATADFIINDLDGHVRTLQLLSFMRLGEEKYKSLNMPYKMADLKFNRRSLQKRVREIAEYFNRQGIHCLVGTREKDEEPASARSGSTSAN